MKRTELLGNGELLSIGVVSKLSGVHIKSLRYYDKLGILKPAYTDRSTGYRYYTFQQLTVLDAIKMCLELDIPLKEFAGLIDKNQHRIHYARLLEYGRQLAQEKMKRIEEELVFIKEAQQEIDRTALYKNKGEVIHCVLPERDWFIKPWEKKTDEEKYVRSLTLMMLEAEKQGFSIGYELGSFVQYEKGKEKAYLFVDVQGGKVSGSESFLHIPQSTYLCCQTARGSIKKAKELFPHVDWPNYTGIVVETELFTGEFDFERPVYELQCLVYEG